MAIQMKKDEPLAAHTVFRIGGPARWFAEPASGQELAEAIGFAQSRGISWKILGAGSNVLAADSGFPGMIIHPNGGTIEISGNGLWADASVSMARAVAESVQKGLSGFEWAIGVPGSIGGSVAGNAGCFGGEMKDVVAKAELFNAKTGGREMFSNADFAFGYRDSILKHGPELVLLRALLELKPGDPGASRKLVQGYAVRRVSSQDVGSQSAGCIFKNVLWDRPGIYKTTLIEAFPELGRFASEPGISSGFLIDAAGLKGFGIGRARFSSRHANFILNTGGAKADDIIQLISLAKDRVRRRYGILLEEEIRYVGFGE